MAIASRRGRTVCVRSNRVGAGPAAQLAAAAACALTLAATGCSASSGAPPDTSSGARFAGSSAAGLSAPDFTLRDQAGRDVSLHAERGKWVVVTFLYTRCPDVCPLIATKLNQVLLALGRARAGVRVLAVSVDPVGDTPRRVRGFVRDHRLVPQFRYLTGSRAQLAPIWSGYHVAAQVGPVDTSSHSAYELLIDRGGKPRLLYTADLEARDVLHDLRLLGVRRRGP